MFRFIGLLLLIPSVLWAAPTAETAEKARQRLYDGGIDEQPLQVQANLFNPKTESEKVGEGENAPTPQSGAAEPPPEE